MPPSLICEECHTQYNYDELLQKLEREEDENSDEGSLISAATHKVDHKKLLIKNIPFSKSQAEIKIYFHLFLTKQAPTLVTQIDNCVGQWLLHFENDISIKPK